MQRPAFIPRRRRSAIDESFAWRGAARHRKADRAATCRSCSRRSDGSRRRRRYDTADPDRRFRARMHHAIAGAAEDGLLRRDALIRAGLTADDLREAQKLEWRRKLELDDVLPGMPRREAIQGCVREVAAAQPACRPAGAVLGPARTTARGATTSARPGSSCSARPPTGDDNRPGVADGLARATSIESWHVADAGHGRDDAGRDRARVLSADGGAGQRRRRRCRIPTCGRSPTGRWRRRC